MGLIDFVKDAGEKLSGRGQAQAAVKEAAAEPSNQAKVQAANAAAGELIGTYNSEDDSMPKPGASDAQS